MLVAFVFWYLSHKRFPPMPGKNKKKTPSVSPSVPTISLDRERRLVLDFNALEAIEKELGVSTLQAGFWKQFLGNMSAAQLRVVLWGALLCDDTENWTKEPRLTIRQVGAWLTTANFKDAIAGIVRAQLAVMPALEGNDRPTDAADAAAAQ